MTNKWHIGEDDIKLGDFNYFKGDKIDAYKCNTCNIIIINANKRFIKQEKVYMKTKTKNRIIILLLGFSFVFNGYLFIENKNKATTIVQLNKKNRSI